MTTTVARRAGVRTRAGPSCREDSNFSILQFVAHGIQTTLNIVSVLNKKFFYQISAGVVLTGKVENYCRVKIEQVKRNCNYRSDIELN
jgi:hypothetical protein